jgi:eukaryotic-like serine/threonine-protein kinase
VEALGDFTIESVLGEGGSAIVYAARRGSKRLALKVLRPEQTLSEREVNAFVTEAQRAQRVTHPSLIEIRDVGILPDGRPYIAMPRLAGVSLSERIARGPMSFDTALRLFKGLCGAVQALHDAGLIHRDIKPENVFVVGKDERLVLLDLGIARDIEAPASTTTQNGLVRGSPAYMAPERFFGTRASVASDVYELAVVLYAMLAAGLPWDEGAGARGRITPRDPRTVVPLREGVAKTILDALSVDEATRPPSPRALFEELERGATSGEAPELLPASKPVQPLPSAGDSRPRAAMTASRDFATQDTVAVSTAQTRKRSRGWAAPLIAAFLLAGAAVGAWAVLVGPASHLVGDLPRLVGDLLGEPATTSSAAASGEPAASGSAEPDPSASGAPKPASSAKRPPVPASASASVVLVNGKPVTLDTCDAIPGIVCNPEYVKHEARACPEWTVKVKILRSQDKARWPAIESDCRAQRAAANAKLNEWNRQAAKKKP